MFDRIIRFSIYNKTFIILGVFVLIAWGIYSLQHLPIDAVPDITDNQVQVITTSPSLAVQEVEKFITFPLEMEFGNIPKVEEVRSVSRFGLSVITVVFEEQVDIYLARQLINERIQAASREIPPEIGNPAMGPISTGLGEIYQYVLFAKPGFEEKFSPTELRSIQDWIVKRQLIGIDGVVEVNSSGGYLKQYEIAIDPNKLNSLNISLPEIFEAIHDNNGNAGGSYIEKEQYTYFIRGEGLLKSMEDIERVVVKNHDGFPILVKDIAKVQIGHAPRFGAVTMNGIGEVVSGQVMMLKGGNAAAITHEVIARMERIEKSLPEGVGIEPYLDRTKLVHRTTETVLTNLIEGGLIVIFVLVLLLGNVRAGLIVASVIPLSMLFALAMMRLFGVTANLMSLGAIDFGLIVDGAVIIVEAIMHHLGLRGKGKTLSRKEMNSEVFSAAAKIRKSAAFGEIIILIVYLPILFLTGIEGKMFRPMAQTVSFAILGALILSLTYVPMMSALFLRKEVQDKRTISDKIMSWLYQKYQPFLKWGLKWGGIVVMLAVLLFGISLWRLNNMGGEFIPVLEEGDFALHQILPPGSSIAQGVEVSAPLQKMLMEKFPEVEKVVTKIGTAEIPVDIMPLEAGDIYVIMKPKSEWVSARTREEMFEKMEEEMEKYPGVIYEFTQPIQMRFNELMTGVRQDIAIKIYGEDLGILAQKAKQAKSLIEPVQGVGDIQVESTAGLQQMGIQYDRAKIAKFGLNIADINRIIQGSFAGEKAGVLYEGEKRFDIVVRLDEAYRQNINNLRELFIPLPNGGSIPLDEVAKVNFEEGPIQISRDNTQRRITLGVNARGRDVQSLVQAIQQTLDSSLDLPSGYYITYGGQFENLLRAQARLSIVVPIALALIFLLLYLTFRSGTQALLIFTAIPLSAIGGIWALALRDMPFSISAGVGFIALFGVAVLNGIVLIAYFNELKSNGMSDLEERIFKGTKVRLRPVIMTATVASLGFFPMAISRAAGAEVQQPLATVVIGGLISATILTLIVLPVLYYHLEKRTIQKAMGLKVGLILCICSFALPGMAQQLISKEQAIEKALNNHPKIKQSQQAIQVQNSLGNVVSRPVMTNVFISGEEFDPENSGVQSLGITQTLNHPKYNRQNRALAQEKAEYAASALSLDERSLRLEVGKAYDLVLFHRQKVALLEAIQLNYQQFKEIAEFRFQQGATGKIPFLVANTKLQQGQLSLGNAQKELEMSLQKFNNLLFEDTTYLVSDEALVAPIFVETDSIPSHPLRNMYQQSIEIAKANISLQKSKALPQFQLGARLQSVMGGFPFYAYQAGVIMPLFSKSQKASVEAAELGMLEKTLESELQQTQFSQQKDLLLQQVQLSKANYEYATNELIPIALEQAQLAEEAYRQGEIQYEAYIQTLDQVLNVRLTHLEYLKDYVMLMADWEFWR